MSIKRMKRKSMGDNVVRKKKSRGMSTYSNTDFLPRSMKSRQPHKSFKQRSARWSLILKGGSGCCVEPGWGGRGTQCKRSH